MCNKMVLLVSFALLLSLIGDTAFADLVGWWKFDGNPEDSSAYGNHGTLVGDPQWVVPGLIGDGALRLDGTNDYMAIPNLSYVGSGYQEVSVCAWIRTTNGGDQVIASFDRSEYWRLEINGSGGETGQVGWDVMTSTGQLDHGSVARVDDGRWHHIAGVFDNGVLAIYVDGDLELLAFGGSTFGTGIMRYGFLGVGSEASSFDGSKSPTNYFDGDLDDVRIYNRALTKEEIASVMIVNPILAWNPRPADGLTVDIHDVSQLSWSPGDRAVMHDVYLGTDKDAVTVADTSSHLYKGRQSSTTYARPDLELGRNYFWRIDEVNDSNVWKGEVWNFKVEEHLLVDDFNLYTDTNYLLLTWDDGTVNGTGATISLETEFDGNSMKLVYDNNQPPFFSQVELTYAIPQDFSAGGAKALEIGYRGDVNNIAEPMYVALEDATGNIAVVKHSYPNALVQTQWEGWQIWNIALQEFVDANDVNLVYIKKIAIGIGDRADASPLTSTGTAYFNYIRLYPPRCFPEYVTTSFNNDCFTDSADLKTIMRYWLVSDYNVVAVQPDHNRLQAYYRFDETSGTVANDSSGMNRHATVDANGANAWEPLGYDGGCLDFDGTFNVLVPNEVFSNVNEEVTIAVWVHADTSVNTNTLGRAEFAAGPADDDQSWDRLTWIQEKHDDYIGRWNHYAFVKDADHSVMRIYHNGLLVAQNIDAFQPINGIKAGQSTIGSKSEGDSGYYKGKLDEFRIYDYALPHAEILYLAAGRGGELYQPLQPVLSPFDPYKDGKISFRDFAVMAEKWLKESLWP